MEFSWQFKKEQSQQIKYFLKEKGISKGLLAKIKFQGGEIKVNGKVENVLFSLTYNDMVKIVIPDEGEHETLLLDDHPIDIVFEDDHLLIVNKPAGVSSIPAQYHPNHTMANRVKAYYKKQGYANQVIHVVTRLDRDTSGLMLFAKHGFAHAKLDVQLRAKNFVKKYQALVSGENEHLNRHDEIIQPIGRDYSSLLKRKVTEEGQYAKTEYWLEKIQDEIALVDIQLHTGRTHQIRVHFSAIGCPLLGDEMYGGRLDLGITRQALHCYELQFSHPFTNEPLAFYQPMATDMHQLIQVD
ncbi:RluA family pseudouridine synthase [Enterococcus phoeniculicola]|jgi:23S rRNA pseudouridine1911/1915/1917 synthase|uniref:Pseudouridine synthase n=1 Tax=Enterococcus phoeniculicola ATCC BAA-412 TaxID=1158610 RepID=R3WA32_9ENTE|nr:RluA family pseudouridine synthase [Enterococcus phoeniculicola]EOL44776.1 RluA family pseudouridine synthase [Enterococcus phoeniculicola ATCC BAA-412]EOT75065.1 ribosomal large subunit pseudouridine synthase [Enterococcus phoeniculicola ATCC BAA-412]OJG72953.1 RluA family pseudouridine synthase [Enterococcus phoeniculicola]